MCANGVSRDWLARQGDEAMVLALAGAVQSTPLEGDAARLLSAGKAVTRLHVQYFVLLAFSRLIEDQRLSQSEREGVAGLLDRYGRTADQSLQRLIATVRRKLAA